MHTPKLIVFEIKIVTFSHDILIIPKCFAREKLINCEWKMFLTKNSVLWFLFTQCSHALSRCHVKLTFIGTFELVGNTYLQESLCSNCSKWIPLVLFNKIYTTGFSIFFDLDLFISVSYIDNRCFLHLLFIWTTDLYLQELSD